MKAASQAHAAPLCFFIVRMTVLLPYNNLMPHFLCSQGWRCQELPHLSLLCSKPISPKAAQGYTVFGAVLQSSTAGNMRKAGIYSKSINLNKYAIKRNRLHTHTIRIYRTCNRHIYGFGSRFYRSSSSHTWMVIRITWWALKYIDPRDSDSVDLGWKRLYFKRSPSDWYRTSADHGLEVTDLEYNSYPP